MRRGFVAAAMSIVAVACNQTSDHSGKAQESPPPDRPASAPAVDVPKDLFVTAARKRLEGAEGRLRRLEEDARHAASSLPEGLSAALKTAQARLDTLAAAPEDDWDSAREALREALVDLDRRLAESRTRIPETRNPH